MKIIIVLRFQNICQLQVDREKKIHSFSRKMEKLLVDNQNIVKYFNIFKNSEFRFRPELPAGYFFQFRPVPVPAGS